MTLGWRIHCVTCAMAEIHQRFLSASALESCSLLSHRPGPGAFCKVVDPDIWSDEVKISLKAEHNGDFDTLSLGTNKDARISFDNIIFFPFSLSISLQNTF